MQPSLTKVLNKKGKGVLIEQIKLDQKTQSRIKLDEATVQRYAQDMNNGLWDFHREPLPILFQDEETYYPGDGHHRIAAAIAIGMKAITAEVKSGTLRDAQLYSAGANKYHGLQRTNADKRNQVETLLKDSEWAEWSNHAIAAHCGVSAPYVGKVRKDMESKGQIEEITERKSRDGKDRKTEKIGKTQRQETRPAPEPTIASENPSIAKPEIIPLQPDQPPSIVSTTTERPPKKSGKRENSPISHIKKAERLVNTIEQITIQMLAAARPKKADVSQIDALIQDLKTELDKAKTTVKPKTQRENPESLDQIICKCAAVR